MKPNNTIEITALSNRYCDALKLLDKYTAEQSEQALIYYGYCDALYWIMEYFLDYQSQKIFRENIKNMYHNLKYEENI